MKRKAFFLTAVVMFTLGAHYVKSSGRGTYDVKSLQFGQWVQSLGGGAYVVRGTPAKYTLSGSPAVCRGPEELPANCTNVNTGVICEVPFGLQTKTYRQGANCLGQTFYKII